MNLLIVDDQVTVVQGLLDEVDWKSIGIEQTFGAFSALEAQSYLRSNKIDIMLCDIEMPVEDGLSLVSWIRNRGLDVCVILLTAHAKFTYAQESVRLNVFEYILQPAPYAKILATVSDAVRWVERTQEEKKLHQFGQEYIRRERTIINASLWSWLSGKQNKQEMNTLAAQGKLPGRNDDVYLCLVQMLEWNKFTGWEPELLSYAVENILEEIFLPYSQNVIVVSMGSAELAVYLWGSEYNMPITGMQRQMVFFQQVFQQYFQSNVSVYQSGKIKAGQSRKVWDELQELKADNVSHKCALFLLDRNAPPQKHHFHLSHPWEWVAQLKGDYPNLVEKEAVALLDELSACGKLTAQTLRDFNQDFLQVLYLSMEDDDSFWETTLEDGENYDIYRNAPYSVNNTKKFIHLAISHISRQVETPKTELLQKINGYIDQNMAEDIRRNDLAQSVFLNPDYLNRLVKQITGYSLKEYTTKRKLDMAQRLLRTTRLPVSIVAARVGFAQVSYFSTTYKKHFGRTPMQERKDCGT